MSGKNNICNKCQCKCKSKVMVNGLCPSCRINNTPPGGKSGNSNVNNTVNSTGVDDGFLVDNELCGSCANLVSDGDKGLCCDACQRWFHINCLNISISKFKSIVTVQNIVRWFCSQCDAKVISALSKLAMLEAKVADLEAKIELNIEKKIEDMLDERLEREKKKNNLIIFGIPEAPESVQGVNRKHNDLNKLEKLGDGLSDELKIDSTIIENIYRIGKIVNDNTRPRPVCIKLKEMHDKYRILNSAKRLRDVSDDWRKNVFISLDYTKHQRELRKIAMEELKSRRDAGEQNLMIRNFKVVTRVNRGPLA